MKTSAPLRQDEVNRAVYYSRSVYLYYLSKSLMAAEAACFSKYEQQLNGRDVLDIGVGAGRTARFLAPRARRYESIDYSPVMVDYMRRALPEISVHQGDFRDLSMFPDGSFDFVLATANVIDALPHEGRLMALNEARRVLRPGGLLAFSTHNLGYKFAFSGPRMGWSWNPVRLAVRAVQYVLGSWNHRRLGPLRRTTAEYALLDDPGHFYSCLHYYITRQTVQAQLENAGMTLEDAYDGKGRTLSETDDDSENPWLFYVAQRSTPADRSPRHERDAVDSCAMCGVDGGGHS